MISYLDMTFCGEFPSGKRNDCTNTECPRYQSESVVAGARHTGLPIAISDFRDQCHQYTKEVSDDNNNS
jgi:hypothetical protein